VTPVLFELSSLTPPARALLRAVQAAAGRSRSPVLVGGAVRDARLASTRRAGPADLDVAVESGALDIAGRVAARLGGAFVPLDPSAVRRGCSRAGSVST
jgi:tRNA nucleotidyltransferase/poly(A) polymerase